MNDKRKTEEPVTLDFSFEEAMQRVAQTVPGELNALIQASVPEASIETLLDRFEEAGHDNGHGDKFWYARDLQGLLGYQKWETFEGAIRKAMTAAENSGYDPADHFREFFPETGKNAERGRPARNFELSRYACYLIAQNASSRKKQVAFAQTYFAIQARRQELADQNGVDFSKLSADQRRLYLRNQIVEQNKRLSSAAQGAGVKTQRDHAIFQNKGIQGMYGGMGVSEVRDHKRLPAKAKILDHMGSTELAAHLFRITQTDERIRSQNLTQKAQANRAHYEVGLKVRQTMQELSGIFPEDLAVEEDVRRLATAERRLQKQRALSAPAPAPALAAPAPAPSPTPVSIDLKTDLWKYALLIMSVRPEGEISTSDMIAEMPGYIHLSEEHAEANASRKDSKFSQLVRNLKSHKTTKTNFIYQGYAQDVPGGFRITHKGLDFVREYFRN